MWDPVVLDYLNRKAAALAGVNVQEDDDEPYAPATLPLESLVKRLTTGPPSIKSVVDLLGAGEDLADFLDLVKEFLPEREKEIMAGEPKTRLRKFYRYFQPKYFRLSPWVFAPPGGIEAFCRCIPLEAQGFSTEAYHNVGDLSDETILLLALLAHPEADGYDNAVACSRGMYQSDPRKERIPLLEQAALLVGQAVIARIPEAGWEPQELHEMTRGTKYYGVSNFAYWVFADTGCWILDTVEDTENSGNGWMEPWNPQAVESLTRQQPIMDTIQKSIAALTAWLKKNRTAHFEELLSFLLTHQTNITQPAANADAKGERKKLIDILAHEKSGAKALVPVA